MTATLVELVDGRVVTRDAEDWRDECLARHVLRLPSLDARREWLADFQKRHGEAEADRLRALMTALASGEGRREVIRPTKGTL